MEVQTAWGSQIPSTIIIRLQVRNGDDIDDFAVVTLPMSQTTFSLTAEFFNTSDKPTMKAMFHDPANDPDDVEYSSFRDQDLEVFMGKESTAPISSFISRTTSQIARIGAVGDAHELIVMYPSKFWDHIHRQPTSLQTIAKKIKSLFDSMDLGDQVSFYITSPFVPNWELDWYVLFSDERKTNSGILDVPLLCNGQIEDLYYSKILAGRVNPAEEAAWKQHLAGQCEKIVFQARLFPFPGSEWTPAANDKQEYGMTATGLPTAYLMAVNQKSVRDFLPDIGIKVKVYLKAITQMGYTLPRPLFAAIELQKLAAKVQRSLKMAEREAQEVVEMHFIVGSYSGTDNDKEQVITDLFSRLASTVLELYIHKPPNDALQNTEARQAAAYLRQRNDEDDKAHSERIVNWIRSAVCVAPQTKYREPYFGHRLSLPPGICADVALFYLEVPKQRDWPRGLKQPPMAIGIPNGPPPSDLQQFLVNAFTNQDDISRAEIRYSVDTQLNKAECATIPCMNNLDPNYTVGAWWKSMVQCPDSPKIDQADLSQMYAGSQIWLDNDTITKEHADDVRAMGDVHAEEVFKLAMDFGKAVLS